jgi:pimeloyl-ACP methyl ester carboxylesterase
MRTNALPHPETTTSGNSAYPNNTTNMEGISTPVRENRIEVWGLRIFYLSAGEAGPPLLLIHGGGSDFSGFSWKYTVEALAEQYRVFALDLPGYGQSQAPELRISDWGLRISDLKEARELVCKKGRINPFWFHILFIKAFLDALGLERVNLVGISMGGGISIGVALENPERVEKLVLVNSYVGLFFAAGNWWDGECGSWYILAPNWEMKLLTTPGERSKNRECTVPGRRFKCVKLCPPDSEPTSAIFSRTSPPPPCSFTATGIR